MTLNLDCRKDLQKRWKKKDDSIEYLLAKEVSEYVPDFVEFSGGDEKYYTRYN